MQPPIRPSPQVAADAFDWGAPPIAVTPLGRGLINDTYRVTTAGAPPTHGVLQRLNPAVLGSPQLAVENLRTVQDHLREQAQNGGATRDPLVLPRIVPTNAGPDLLTDGSGHTWRGLEFIDHTRTLQRIETSRQARGLGLALGWFHLQTATLNPARLHDTMPEFHVAPHYLNRFDRVMATNAPARNRPELRFCVEVIERYREQVPVLEQAKQRGLLPLRVIHGDPKINNVLFDASDHPRALVDLDTLKPGLLHYDLADCLRSSCNTQGEAPREPDTVQFDMDIAETVLRTYFGCMGGHWTRQEADYLLPAIQLLPLELGLRFLTDHLEGNIYFRVSHPDHNLQRAITQFMLALSVHGRQRPLRHVISASTRPKPSRNTR